MEAGVILFVLRQKWTEEGNCLLQNPSHLHRLVDTTQLNWRVEAFDVHPGPLGALGMLIGHAAYRKVLTQSAKWKITDGEFSEPGGNVKLHTYPTANARENETELLTLK